MSEHQHGYTHQPNGIDIRVMRCIDEHGLDEVSVAELDRLMDLRIVDESMRHRAIGNALGRLSRSNRLQQIDPSTWRVLPGSTTEEQHEAPSNEQASEVRLIDGSSKHRVWTWISEQSVPVSMRQIADAMGIPRKTVSPVLTHLTRAGALATQMGEDRLLRWRIVPGVVPEIVEASEARQQAVKAGAEAAAKARGKAIPQATLQVTPQADPAPEPQIDPAQEAIATEQAESLALAPPARPLLPSNLFPRLDALLTREPVPRLPLWERRVGLLIALADRLMQVGDTEAGHEVGAVAAYLDNLHREGADHG